MIIRKHKSQIQAFALKVLVRADAYDWVWDLFDYSNKEWKLEFPRCSIGDSGPLN